VKDYVNYKYPLASSGFKPAAFHLTAYTNTAQETENDVIVPFDV
jgi:hypothetical protein